MLKVRQSSAVGVFVWFQFVTEDFMSSRVVVWLPLASITTSKCRVFSRIPRLTA